MDAVTVTTNDRAHLGGLLGDALLMNSFDRVVVVDNASDDGSGELARDAGCHVVRNAAGRATAGRSTLVPATRAASSSPS